MKSFVPKDYEKSTVVEKDEFQERDFHPSYIIDTLKSNNFNKYNKKHKKHYKGEWSDCT